MSTKWKLQYLQEQIDNLKKIVSEQDLTIWKSQNKPTYKVGDILHNGICTSVHLVEYYIGSSGIYYEMPEYKKDYYYQYKFVHTKTGEEFYFNGDQGLLILDNINKLKADK